MNFRLLLFIAFISLVACRQSAPSVVSDKKETKAELSPDERYGELFQDIQMAPVFPDSKTFVDCVPKSTTDEILEKYREQKAASGFDIKQFTLDNFSLPKQYSSDFKSDTSRTAAEHINALWPFLTRQADSLDTGTLIPLPKPYIVPGGRFGEIYYWDSYFTLLGIQAANNKEIPENMTDNFAHLINTVGHIPNGNRRYYLSRSQPPFFSLMVKIVTEMNSDEVLNKYLPALEKEYQFWMDGLENLSADNPTHRRVVRLEDGSVLNRYYDDKAAPRPEAYKEDIETAKEADRPAKDVYRDLKAAAESGWDFSSRWFKDGRRLSTIHTTDIIPVDLNCLLYHLESMLEKANTQAGNEEEAALYSQRAQMRAKAIERYCWDAKDGFYVDYDFVNDEPTGILSLAGLFPLFFELSSAENAGRVAQKLESDFLKAGGVLTTLNNTGEQWDAPNGWAPLQWVSIKGLRNYGQTELAQKIKDRWVELNVKVYKNTGKMVEKYNVLDMSLEAGGGEYPVQDGFGWTNGVLLKLLLED